MVCDLCGNGPVPAEQRRVPFRSAPARLSDREWIDRLVQEGNAYEVAQCMGDLLDRAEFAEEIARRDILERLVGALDCTPSGNVTEETRAILAELHDMRLQRVGLG